MKSIFIIGANGMLGYAMESYYTYMRYKVETITRKEFDITKEDVFELRHYISPANFVVNCAGVIKPRIEDTSVEDVLKVNTVFPINLASLCNSYQTPCFHITTDCVFSGRDGKYVESDPYDCEDLYGLSKCGGDSADCMVLRTSIIGEERGGNSRSLLSWFKSQEGKTVFGFTNHFWNGVTTLYLAEIIESIMIQGLYRKGIHHVFSENVVSKFDLLSMIQEIYNLNIGIVPKKVKSRIDRSLSTEKSLCNRVVKKSLRKQIVEMKEFFEKEKHIKELVK